MHTLKLSHPRLALAVVALLSLTTGREADADITFTLTPSGGASREFFFVPGDPNAGTRIVPSRGDSVLQSRPRSPSPFEVFFRQAGVSFDLSVIPPDAPILAASFVLSNILAFGGPSGSDPFAVGVTTFFSSTANFTAADFDSLTPPFSGGGISFQNSLIEPNQTRSLDITSFLVANRDRGRFLKFRITPIGEGSAFFTPSLSIRVVPEPSSLALTAGGLLLLVARRARPCRWPVAIATS